MVKENRIGERRCERGDVYVYSYDAQISDVRMLTLNCFGGPLFADKSYTRTPLGRAEMTEMTVTVQF